MPSLRQGRCIGIELAKKLKHVFIISFEVNFCTLFIIQHIEHTEVLLSATSFYSNVLMVLLEFQVKMSR